MKKIDPQEERLRKLAKLPQKGCIRKKEYIEKQKTLTPKERHKKGLDAEDRFLKAWEVRYAEYKPKLVRRGTKQEDFYEKTDAVIETIKYGMLRIQIKSFQTRPAEFKAFAKINIILLSVLPSQNFKEIRNNTKKAILAYLKFHQKNKN